MNLVDLDVDSLFGDNPLEEEAGVSDDEGGGNQAAANSTQVAGADEGEDGAAMLERLNRIAKEGAAKKKGPKLPALRFDANRLLGDRGLPCLLETMLKAPVTGREGRELDDLNAILRAYEQWLHRLHPKFAFDDAAERLERLGRQMPVRNALKRMRAGLDPRAETGFCADELGDDPDPEEGANKRQKPPARSEEDNAEVEDNDRRRADASSDESSAALPTATEDNDASSDDNRHRPGGPRNNNDSDESGESFALPTSRSPRRASPSVGQDADQDADEAAVPAPSPVMSSNHKRLRRPKLVDSDEDANDGDTQNSGPESGDQPEVQGDGERVDVEEGSGDGVMVARRRKKRRQVVIDSDED